MAYTNEQLGKALEDLTTAYNNFIEKAKEAAIAAMGDTVIAQIKQDAKDYIAAELAEQKAELEQAIENAKIALKNSSDEAHVKLQQFSEEKQLELSALVEESKNALTLLAEQKFENLKTLADAEEKRLKDLANSENVKLQEIAVSAKKETENAVLQAKKETENAVLQAKKETENAVLQAKKDLEVSVDAVMLDINNGMRSMLDTFGGNLRNDIISAKTGIIAEIKNLNDKLEGDMSKITDIMIQKDVVNIIEFPISNNYNVRFKIKNLKNTPLTNARKEIIWPADYNNSYSVNWFKCSVSGQYRSKDLCSAYTDTVTNIYFIETLNSSFRITIRSCFFLEYIYLYELSDTQKNVFKFIDCPNFKGFKKYTGNEEF